MPNQLGKLTAGERLLVARRREGLSQTQAARKHGVTRRVYGGWERDDRPGAPSVRVGRLETHERCLLYRRRVGWTQERVARDLRCCRWWLNQMERGDAPVDELLWYWEA